MIATPPRTPPAIALIGSEIPGAPAELLVGPLLGGPCGGKKLEDAGTGLWTVFVPGIELSLGFVVSKGAAEDVALGEDDSPEEETEVAPSMMR